MGDWLLHSVLPYAILCPSDARSDGLVYHARTPAEEGLRADDLWVETEPGLFLRGWRVQASGPVRGTIVLLHGHGSCKEAELGLARLFSDHGYQCLLYDARAHGESGGLYCTFGFYERRDFARFVEAAGRLKGAAKAARGYARGTTLQLKTSNGGGRLGLCQTRI